MARLPTPPDGDRFYARLLAAVLECPVCGWLDSFTWRKTTRKVVRERSRQIAEAPVGWDGLTSSWRCGQCQASFVLGILAWPVARGGPGASRPRDQVPNERQLAQMRARGGGLWMPASRAVVRGRAESTNITARCSCVPATLGTIPWTGEPEQVDPGCPIHGEIDPKSEAP